MPSEIESLSGENRQLSLLYQQNVRLPQRIQMKSLSTQDPEAVATVEMKLLWGKRNFIGNCS